MYLKLGDVITLPGRIVEDDAGNAIYPPEQWRYYRKEFGQKGVTIYRFVDVKGKYDNDLGLTDHELQMNLERLRTLH